MLTNIDKAIVALLIPLLTWLNQKYGLKVPVDDQTLLVLVGVVTSIIVHQVPNKAT